MTLDEIIATATQMAEAADITDGSTATVVTAINPTATERFEALCRVEEATHD
jgi:hypothetical protein